MTKIDLSKVPENPGCYLYKDSKGNIIYVGKAKNLKKRVSQYFDSRQKDPKTQALLTHIDSVDFIITKNEVEALILENNLIKKNHPKYNIDLKDSKNYAYIKITSEEFPRLLIARKKDDDSEYFGPFTSAEKRDSILQTLTRTFKIRTCKKMPKKACLRYHINLCDAPCINNITKEEYNKNIRLVKSILSGKTKEIIEEIKEEIKIESKKQNFEKAIELRDKIESLEYLKERQNMQRIKEYNEDIINYLIKDDKVYLLLFKIYKGTLENKEEYEFPLNYEPEFLEQFLTQYYSENPIPKEIIIPNPVGESIKVYLKKKANKKISIIVPTKGEKKELLDLVLKNIEIIFFENINKLIELKEKLNLEKIPEVIECFDISHLSGTNQVGSMVQFRKGKPDKSNYRRFKIKTVDQIDDFASIKEIVFRRYYRIKKENSSPPDLIVIDGGKGQLSSALESLEELNLKIPIISLAKEFEEIYMPGESNPLRLNHKDPALQILQQIRDEAHRFAITYNRLLRKKDLLKK